MDERIKESLTLFDEAKKYVGEGDVNHALIAYIKTFWLRNVAEGFFDIEFASFFRYQFATYLKGKKQVRLSLPEGDMIADLIKTVYEDMRISMSESPFNLNPENEWTVLKQVKIDFPLLCDPDLAV